MTEIESNISKIEQMIFNLNETVVLNTMQNNDTAVPSSTQTSKICENIYVENEIFKIEMQCMDAELQKINNAIRTDEETTMKIRHQLHVLSAKYIKFNAKINDLIFDFNRKNEKQIEPEDFVDYTLPFMEATRSYTSEKNDFSFKNMAINRFRGKCNDQTQSHFIMARVEFATIVNLESFVNQMKKIFEQQSGISTVKKISIVRYKIEKGIVHQADVIVQFHLPMSHIKLNETQFPTNWTFFVSTHHRSQSKQPPNARRTMQTKQ